MWTWRKRDGVHAPEPFYRSRHFNRPLPPRLDCRFVPGFVRQPTTVSILIQFLHFTLDPISPSFLRNQLSDKQFYINAKKKQQKSWKCRLTAMKNSQTDLDGICILVEKQLGLFFRLFFFFFVQFAKYRILDFKTWINHQLFFLWIRKNQIAVRKFYDEIYSHGSLPRDSNRSKRRLIPPT